MIHVYKCISQTSKKKLYSIEFETPVFFDAYSSKARYVLRNLNYIVF